MSHPSRERFSEGWLIYWWSGAIVVALAFHVQRRAEEWSVVWRALKYWLRSLPF